jgi:hypothetical protein
MGRLCLRYRKLEAIRYYSNPGQSTESMHYQSEPGNEKTLSGRGTVPRLAGCLCDLDDAQCCGLTDPKLVSSSLTAILFPLAPIEGFHLLVSFRPLLPLTLSTPVSFRVIERKDLRIEAALGSFKLDAPAANHFRSFHKLVLSLGTFVHIGVITT